MTILHNYPLSSASYRVRIALNLKGIVYETRNHGLRAGEQRSPDYLAINPAGLVPALEIGGRVVTQSLAIIDYLENIQPEPALIPRDPFERAKMLSLALTIACDIHPINNLRVLLYLEQELGVEDSERMRWYRTWVESGFAAIEAMLPGRRSSPFISGDAPGLGEIFLVPQVYNARRFAVDLAPYPKLVEIADLAAAHPAFKVAAPD